MVTDNKSLAHNLKLLDEFISREKSLAHLSDRHEGLIYIYAMKGEKSCIECNKVLEGKLFLLYDGRTQTRHQVPQIPNPSCLKPVEFELQKECNFIWLNINPKMAYLKKEKQFYRSCEEYLDTWGMTARTNNEQEWVEWHSQNLHIELYDPPFIWENTSLTFFEKFCLRSGYLRICFDGFDISLRDLGLLALIRIIQDVTKLGSSFGIKPQKLDVNFSRYYDNLDKLGRKWLIEIIQKIKYQLLGGRLRKPIDGHLKQTLSGFEVQARIGLTKIVLDSVRPLSKADINLIFKHGFPTSNIQEP